MAELTEEDGGGTLDAGFQEWWERYTQAAREELTAVGLHTNEKNWRAVKVVALRAWEDGQFSVLCYECAHPQIRHAPDTHYRYMLVCYEDANCPCQREITQEEDMMTVEQERDNWMETARQYVRNTDYWRTRVEELEGTMQRAMSELGVPGEGYPAPVANAYEILEAAVKGRETGQPAPVADVGLPGGPAQGE